MSEKRARVLVADDHPLMAEGLCKLLEPAMEVAAVVEDGQALLRAAEIERPDLVITDISMPGLGGIEATRRLKQLDPGIRVLILSVHVEPTWVRAAFEAGVDGYLAKSSAAAELELAAAEVLAGRLYVGPGVPRVVDAPGARSVDSPSVLAAADAGLTPRELDIARLVAQGLANKEIAARLFVSVPTVRTHLQSIYAKLGLSNRVELAVHAVHAGWGGPAAGDGAGES